MKNPHGERNLKRLASRSIEREAELSRIEREAIADFHEQFDDLELALGMLRLGDHLGWRPLVLIHSKRTIRKVEKILNINVREFFEPEGPSAYRSMGYKIAVNLGNFWKAVSGAVKIDNRREITKSLPEEG